MIPFRGRIVFKQYIKGKRHTFGIKLFKLCVQDGIIYNFKVYSGKDEHLSDSIATHVVMRLAEDPLDAGRTPYTDNWYTSIGKKIVKSQDSSYGNAAEKSQRNSKRNLRKETKKG